MQRCVVRIGIFSAVRALALVGGTALAEDLNRKMLKDAGRQRK